MNCITTNDCLDNEICICSDKSNCNCNKKGTSCICSKKQIIENFGSDISQEISVGEIVIIVLLIFIILCSIIGLLIVYGKFSKFSWFKTLTSDPEANKTIMTSLKDISKDLYSSFIGPTKKRGRGKKY